MKGIRFLLGYLLLFGFAISAFGQGSQSISGTAKDQKGGVVPGATVTVRDVETGIARTVMTNDSGFYSVLDLGPGTYNLEVAASGFQTFVQSGIVLHVGDRPELNVSLKVGLVSQTVEVVGGAPVIETTNAVIGGVIANQSIENLPLNGRGFQDLALQSASVSLAVTGQRSSNTGYGQKISVSGVRISSASYLLDGQDIDNAYNDVANVSGTAAGIDAVQEFKVVTNPYSAEYGRTGAGQIQIVTKSGTNAFHGSLYDYIRNSAVDARSTFDPLTGPLPFRRNQFGASAGGPIRKDKTFFFGNYEGLRQVAGVSQIFTVPDQAAHNGIIDGVTVGVSPKVAPYLALFPLPSPGTDNLVTGTGLYTFAQSGPLTDNYFIGRIEHQLTPSQKLWVRYSYDSGQLNTPKDFLFTTVQTSGAQYIALGWSSTLSPTTINDFELYYNRSVSATHDIPAPTDTNPSLLVGLGGPYTTPFGPEYAILSAGGGTTSVGADGLLPEVHNNIYQLRDDLSHAFTRHTLRFGVNTEWQQPNFDGDQFAGGQYSFTTLTQFLQATPTTFTADIPNSCGAGCGPVIYTGWNQWIVGAYAQDDFRINSKLTVNLGLRYEPNTIPDERAGQVATIAQYWLTNIPLTAAKIGNPVYNNPSLKNLAPRLGIAWSPISNTVIRLGTGVFYDLLLTSYWRAALTADEPFFEMASINASTSGPNGGPVAINFPNAIQTQASLLGGSIRTGIIPTDISQPVVYEYTLNVERQMGSSRALSVSYVGSHGSHLPRNTDFNAQLVPSGYLANGQPFWNSSSVIRNPAFGPMETRLTDGNSNYNSLAASFKQTYHSGLIYTVNYTFAKSLDDYSSGGVGSSEASNEGNAPYASLYYAGGFANPRQDGYGPSSYDVRHALTMNAVYSLPWGRDNGHAFSNRAANFVAGGWNIAGLAKIQSGAPFNVTGSISCASRTRTGCPFLDAYPPNVNPGVPLIYAPQNRNAYFNQGTTTSNGPFILPPQGQVGNVSRHDLYGPGLVDFDASVSKNYAIRERLKVQLRFDMFNVFNRPNYANPNGTLFVQKGTASAPTFVPNPAAGTITALASPTLLPPRQMQLALKFIF